MSRAYRMMITVNGFDFNRLDDIDEAIKAEWAIGQRWPEHPTVKDGEVDWQGDSQLCGGESEKEFAERVTKAVWKANGKMCNVTVDATYMEELPHDTYFYGEHLGIDNRTLTLWNELQAELEELI